MTLPREVHRRSVVLASSAVVLGSHSVPSEVIDREFGMPEGKLRKRAGVECVSRAAENENEVTLGARAAEFVLHASNLGIAEVDWILATSETHDAYPSLGAQLHSHLRARETCGVLDLGGACLGFLNALASAQAFLCAGSARAILVVTADVHSRILKPRRVPGEFGGLFGDGASAFLLRSRWPHGNDFGYRLGMFHFGCAGQFAAAIRVSHSERDALDVRFDGGALSRAAVSRLDKILREVELRSGISRSDAAYFATHQPNPRLVGLLARQLGVSEEKFPAIAKTNGNLGSTTCAAALHAALDQQARVPWSGRGPIFLASLGPGLLWGGGWIETLRGGA